jgi:hypothetical protein
MSKSTLTREEMIKAIQSKDFAKYSPSEFSQIMDFAFSAEFMASNDKGQIKTYEE